jgi:hypothetical protein
LAPCHVQTKLLAITLFAPLILLGAAAPSSAPCLRRHRDDDRRDSRGDARRHTHLPRAGECVPPAHRAYDKNGPAINAIIVVNPAALTVAIRSIKRMAAAAWRVRCTAFR